MKYVGSKRRIAKYIVPIIESYRQDKDYIEPFVGGANLIQHIGGNRIGFDNCVYLIALLNKVKDGWVPPTTVTEEDYRLAKSNFFDDHPHLKGFILYCCSFGGKWCGGYAIGKNSKGDFRNYAKESSGGLVRQAPLLKDIIFAVQDYKTLSLYDKCIYCDPPYRSQTKYKDHFDHDLFWDWATRMSVDNTVLVSEYVAPATWKCIWSKDTISSLCIPGDKVNTERLFVYDK